MRRPERVTPPPPPAAPGPVPLAACTWLGSWLTSRPRSLPVPAHSLHTPCATQRGTEGMLSHSKVDITYLQCHSNFVIVITS